MTFKTWTDSKIKKLNWTDISLTKVTCIIFGIILASLIPQLLDINILLLVVIAAVLAIKPVYKILKK